MLGWHIFIRRATGARAEDSVIREESLLASWEVGVGGLDWLRALEKKGKAVCMKNGGYPTTFIIAASVVRATIVAGPPRKRDDPVVIGDDYVSPPGWVSNAMIDEAKLAACEPDEQLVIDAWDLS